MHWYGDLLLTEKEFLKSLSTGINDSSNGRCFPPYYKAQLLHLHFYSKRIQVRSLSWSKLGTDTHHKGSQNPACAGLGAACSCRTTLEWCARKVVRWPWFRVKATSGFWTYNKKPKLSTTDTDASHMNTWFIQIHSSCFNNYGFRQKHLELSRSKWNHPVR